MKNRSHIYHINRPRPRHGHKYNNYKMGHSAMGDICNKQYLKNIWSSIREKGKNTEAELKSVGCKKSV